MEEPRDVKMRKGEEMKEDEKMNALGVFFLFFLFFLGFWILGWRSGEVASHVASWLINLS